MCKKLITINHFEYNYPIIKMPKLTRDQQFQKSFNVFIEKNYPVREYLLTSSTKIKTQFHHEYLLHFPRKVISYYVDVFTVDETGVVTPPGPVMKDQEVPSIRTFSSYFHNYFRPFILKNGSNIQSYTDIINHWYTNGNQQISSEYEATSGLSHNDLMNFDLYIKIDVVYHKSHLPFPAVLSSKQHFEQQCKKLEARNNELCVNIQTITAMYQEKEEQYDVLRRRMRIDRRNIEHKYSSMFQRIEKKIRELYSNSSIREECPVCYENIEPSKLKVSKCCHSICSDCSSRCHNCPVCRESY
jgi:hypothetical protein